MSHPIRGIKGADATLEDMHANNQAAMELGKILRAQFDNLDIYVPADHDEFVTIAYANGDLSEEQILKTDVEIVKRCSLLIAYIPERHISSGMMRELYEAQWAGIPVVFLRSPEDTIHLKHALEVRLHGQSPRNR
jgi:hypothetical protein